MEVLDQPVIYVVRDVHLGIFIEECRVTNVVTRSDHVLAEL